MSSITWSSAWLHECWDLCQAVATIGNGSDQVCLRVNGFCALKWERLRAGGEGDDRGWDGWMASPTRWTWVWVDSGSWRWTRRPGCCGSWGRRVGHDWVTELNWSQCWIYIARTGTFGISPLSEGEKKLIFWSEMKALSLSAQEEKYTWSEPDIFGVGPVHPWVLCSNRLAIFS